MKSHRGQQALLSEYKWVERACIGQGSFSKVYKVQRKDSQQYVAIKEIDMSLFKEANQLKALRLEIELMGSLKNPNIVAMYDSCIGQHHSYMILELCDSDLRKNLNANGGKLPESEAISIYCQILKGFKFLISLSYIHRDIKPENIIIREQSYKVGDFGFSCKADMNYLCKLDEICGTPLYMAPQILYEKAYTAKCDIWSLGIMLYEMVFGYGPWVCRNMESYRYNIMNKPLSFPYNGKIGQHTKDFIKRCLVINEERRIGWKELFQHPLICQNDPGEQSSNIKMASTAVGILKRIQESASKKSINIMKPFEVDKMDRLEFSTPVVTVEQFEELCASIDPSVTSFELRALFETIDTSKDGFVDYRQFRSMMLDNDFREADDLANRCVHEIIEITKARNINTEKLFAEYDRNQSGAIEFDEFAKLVQQFLPKIPVSVIRPLYDKFDKDKSGGISLKQFLFELTNGVTTNTQQILNEKAVRCLSALKAAVSYYSIDCKQLMTVFDSNHDNRMDYKQFSNMVYTIDKYLPSSQLRLIFDYIDRQKKGAIDVKSLKELLT